MGVDNSFDEVLKRLEQANKAISKLDETIKSEAFDLLKPLILGGPVPKGQSAPAQVKKRIRERQHREFGL